MIWQAIQKFNEVRKALEAGEWRKAARLIVEILDLLVPEDGTEGAIREPVGDHDTSEKYDEECFKEDVKAVTKAVKSPPRGAKAKGAGGMIIVALVTQLLPILIEFIRKRLKEREDAA